MKSKWIAFLFLIPSFVDASTQFKVLGIQNEVLLQTELDSSHSDLGSLSENLLRSALKAKTLTEYQGSSRGVSSVNHLGSAFEVISSTEMNAYGWCYQIDGIAPDLMADEYPLKGTEKLIEWFYAYAHSDHDHWTSMCVPADHLPPNSVK